MISSDFKDADGFRLSFDESANDAEKKFFMKTFPRVDDVAKDRIHCTTCDCHVGTAPISEKIIRTHQILYVTQCSKCFAFYNSGEFGKGEDGSEYYCRWCGQGGEVFCCSTCPFVFCNKCIRDNLTEAYVKEIEENDDWSCFVCNKEILKRLRAQHWALRNFMNKQLEKIQKVNITSEEELNGLLSDDQTNCCPKKKKKAPLPKPVPAPVKRPLTGNQVTTYPPAKRPSIVPTPTNANANKQIRMPVNANFNQSKITLPKNVAAAPPPLAMRQITRPSAPRPALANPIYHTVNGFQIDLNQASRQEIFRLPNGKLIQVRKQSNTTTTTVAPPRLVTPRVVAAPPPMAVPGQPRYTIRPPVNMTTSRMMRPTGLQSTPRTRGPNNQQRFSFSDGRVVSGAGASNSNQNSAPAQVASTIFTQQNGSISVARAPQPDTPFGKAKGAFEDRIIQGLEICQHTINKMITLTNSSSFKTSRTFADLKDLYIHLQYLFTYTSGKVKTLQDNLIAGMEEIDKQTTSMKEKEGDNDDLEVVQQKVDVIEVLSDDDEEEVKRSNSESTLTVKSSQESINKETTEEDLPFTLVEAVLETPEAEPTPVEPLKSVIDQAELLASFKIEISDEKLNKNVKVKVERLEDSKNAVIKQYLINIQQRREIEASEEDDGGDNDEDEDEHFPLVPEVVMDDSFVSENEKEGENKKKSIENEEKKEEEVVEIPSDDEDESSNKIDAEEPISKASTGDVMKIDNVPPVDLMEVDEAVENGEFKEGETNESNPDSPVQEEETSEETNDKITTNETDSTPSEENDTKSNELGKEENSEVVLDDSIDANSKKDEMNEKSNENQKNQKVDGNANEQPIDREKELLEIINSMDDPLATIDMEIPEALG